jgi:hypothetical protein
VVPNAATPFVKVKVLPDTTAVAAAPLVGFTATVVFAAATLSGVEEPPPHATKAAAATKPKTDHFATEILFDENVRIE